MSENTSDDVEGVDGWFDKTAPPPVGTRVQWTDFIGGWCKPYWGVVQRLTRATVVIHCVPTRIIRESGDHASHNWVMEPMWDAKAGTEERARYVCGSCWAVKQCQLELYDGKPKDSQAYY